MQYSDQVKHNETHGQVHLISSVIKLHKTVDNNKIDWLIEKAISLTFVCLQPNQKTINFN